jgi:hypothetical protein
VLHLRYSPIRPLFVVVDDISEEDLERRERLHEGVVEREDDELDEADLHVVDVGREAVAHGGHVQPLLLLEVALVEELVHHEQRPLLADVE